MGQVKADLSAVADTISAMISSSWAVPPRADRLFSRSRDAPLSRGRNLEVSPRARLPTPRKDQFRLDRWQRLSASGSGRGCEATSARDARPEHAEVIREARVPGCAGTDRNITGGRCRLTVVRRLHVLPLLRRCHFFRFRGRQSARFVRATGLSEVRASYLAASSP